MDDFDLKNLEYMNFDIEGKSDNNSKTDSKAFFDALRKKAQKNKLEKEEMENPTTKYNDETENAFDQFAKDLLKLYPGILTYNEIIIRLKASIKDNIIFTDELEPNCSGYIDHINHKVFIRKDLKELEIKSTIFHEFIHALVCSPYEKYDDNLDLFDDKESKYLMNLNNNADDYLESYYSSVGYLNSSFIEEAITTIIEEDYVKNILGTNIRRVNGYIPTYARQLIAIFGNDLIYEYIKNYKRLESLFEFLIKGNEIISLTMLTDIVNEIDELVVKNDKNVVNIKNNDVEINLSIILNNYLSKNKELSDEKKLTIIDSFIKEQISPDFSYLKNIIEEHIKDKTLLKQHNIANYVYNANSNNYQNLVNKIIHNNIDSRNIDDEKIRELVRLRIKYNDYVVREYFGFTELYYDNKKKVMNYNYEDNLAFLKYKKYYEAMYTLKDEINLDEDNIVSVKGNEIDNKNKILYKLKYGAYEEELLPSAAESILNMMYTKQSYLKVLTNNNEYYILIDKDDIPEVKRPMNIEEAIKYYLKLIEEEPSEKEGYMLAIEKLNNLNSQGINKVFVNQFGFIEEKGENITSTNILFEIDGEKAELEEEQILLTDLNIPFSKNNLKKL